MGTSKLRKDCISRFKKTREENFENVVVGILNIKSTSSRFNEFKSIIIDLQ